MPKVRKLTYTATIYIDSDTDVSDVTLFDLLRRSIDDDTVASVENTSDEVLSDQALINRELEAIGSSGAFFDMNDEEQA
jgi:hypothetical protein